MDIFHNELPLWRQVAVVEVPDSAGDLMKFIRDETLRCRAQPATQAPAGFQWYDILIDTSIGDLQLARTAWSVLTALKKSADDGFLQGLRIVNGQHWLIIGDYAGLDGRTIGDCV